VRPALETALVNAATKLTPAMFVSYQEMPYTKMVSGILLQELNGKGVIQNTCL